LDFEERVILILAIALIIVVIAFMYILNSGRNPEFFTEVYLKKYSENAKVTENVEFEFVIGNYEGADLNYSYSIKWENKNKSGIVFIKNGEKKEIKEEIKFDKSGSFRVEIAVENKKMEKPMLLWFWVDVIR